MALMEGILSLWEMVKENLRETTVPTIFDLWYGDIEPVDYNQETAELTFFTRAKFKKPVLEKKYKPVIEKQFEEICGLEIKVLFKAEESNLPSPVIERLTNMYRKEAEREEKFPELYEDELLRGFPDDVAPGEDGAIKALRSQYTFENFIVGETNKFARAACWKVANNPSREWNPLFIYGPSGVGKTHLMFAVINEIRRRDPEARVIYIKGDDFINSMIDCLSNQNMSRFRAYFRFCDVLLVDDIQFIEGKVATQEEFFHTFQSLFDEGKQIILASDRPPRDINPLEERLRSRFEQGLLADISLPDLELRIAIIKKKAQDMNLSIPDEVLTYLAENLRSNIRQIEGTIKKIAAKCFLVDGRQITLELAKNCVEELVGDAEPLNVTIDKVFSAVFKKYNIPKEEVIGKKRNKEIVRARHIAVYLIREITEMSYPNIGKLFDRDHATVMASLDVVKKRITADPLFAMDIENMKKEVVGH